MSDLDTSSSTAGGSRGLAQGHTKHGSPPSKGERLLRTVAIVLLLGLLVFTVLWLSGALRKSLGIGPVWDRGSDPRVAAQIAKARGQDKPHTWVYNPDDFAGLWPKITPANVPSNPNPYGPDVCEPCWDETAQKFRAVDVPASEYNLYCGGAAASCEAPYTATNGPCSADASGKADITQCKLPLADKTLVGQAAVDAVCSQKGQGLTLAAGNKLAVASDYVRNAFIACEKAAVAADPSADPTAVCRSIVLSTNDGKGVGTLTFAAWKAAQPSVAGPGIDVADKAGHIPCSALHKVRCCRKVS